MLDVKSSFLKEYLVIGFVSILSIFSVHAQTEANTYTPTLVFSGTCWDWSLSATNLIRLPSDFPLPPIVVHTGSNAISNYSISSSYIGIVGGVAGEMLLGGAISYPSYSISGAANSALEGIFWNIDFRPKFGSPPYHLRPVSTGRIVRYRLDLKSGSTIKDSIFVDLRFSGFVMCYSASGYSSGADYIAEGSTWQSTPTLHLYADGEAGISPDGREGLPDKLTIKASILDERSGPGAKIAFRVGGKNNEVGRTLAGFPGTKKEFMAEVDEGEQGGALENVQVDLIVDGSVVRSDVAPATFPNHLYTVDFGTLVLSDSCSSCGSGVCTPGKMHASFRRR